MNNYSNSSILLQNLFSGLFQLEADGTLTNAMCDTYTVSDDGLGIPREAQERVFERFYRVDKSHSRETGGTGLGLSIVKHAAQYHNADISLESEPGHGTSISVTF